MDKWLKRLALGYSVVALICFIALIGILSIEIVSRYFFHHSFVWSQEFASILVCWITFLGFGKLVVDREDIMITFLVKKLDAGKQRIVGLFNSVLLTFITGAMLFYSTKLTISHMEKQTIIMKAASAWFYAPLVLLLILLVAVSINQFFLLLKGKMEPFPEEEVD